MRIWFLEYPLLRLIQIGAFLWRVASFGIIVAELEEGAYGLEYFCLNVSSKRALETAFDYAEHFVSDSAGRLEDGGRTDVSWNNSPG